MADGSMTTMTDPETGDLILDDGSEQSTEASLGQGHFENLVPHLDDEVLDKLSSMLTELVTYDEEGRGEWEKINAENYELLGVGKEAKPDGSEDGEGYSDTSDHTLMLTALTRFQSKALSALLPADDQMVRTVPAMNLDDIEDPDEREQMRQEAEEAGRRVARFYTVYLQENCECYEADTDQILYECGLQGIGIRKVIKDPSRKHCPVEPIHVHNNDLIISYDAKSFRSGRITHRMNVDTPELIRKLRSGYYYTDELLRDGNAPDKDIITEARDRIFGLGSANLDETGTHRVYEIQCELFIDVDQHPDGLARPYIVTIHAQQQKVLRVVRNWVKDDESERAIEHYVGYVFHPGKSAVYTLGLGHILANITRALRRAQRRGLESAYLQNHPSGFKLSNLSIRDEATHVNSGEFIDVDSPTNDIRSALMVQPFQGPSQGLMALAEKMEANGKELGGIATIDFANLMKSGVAAGPAMAAYEESTEFQTAIHRRLYQSHRMELRLLHDRIREHYGDNPVVFGVNETLRPGDLNLVEVLPFMKPGQASKQKTMLEAQAIWELSGAAPDIIDRRAAAMEYLRALGKPNLDDLLLPDPEEEEIDPADPLTEYSMIIMGKPVRAGMMQNHQAHMDAHAAQMQLIQDSQLPVDQGDAAMATLSAHIAEHMGMDLMVTVAAQMGIDPTQLGENLDPQTEAQLAPMIAEQIKAVEAVRRAERDPSVGERERIESMKTQKDLALQQSKQEHEKELQRQKDEAEMERAKQDDKTAVRIAGMKDRNTAPTRAGGISR